MQDLECKLEHLLLQNSEGRFSITMLDNNEFLVVNSSGIVIALGILKHEFEEVQILKKLAEEYSATSLFITADVEDNSLNFFRKNFNTGKLIQIPSSNNLFLIRTTKNTLIENIENLNESLEGVLFDVHCKLRDIDGLHSDSALDEVCKVLLAKLYAEKHDIVLRCSQMIDETSAILRTIFKDASDEVASVVNGAARFSLNAQDWMICSAPAAHSILELIENINFSGSSIDVKGRAFQKLIAPALRAGMGQYFTPKEVISLIIKCIDPKPNEKIIDPFCGSGHFLLASYEHVKNKYGKEYSLGLWGVEKSERMVRVALTDIFLMGGSLPQLIHSDALLKFSDYSDLKENYFDIVVTNPPFGSSLNETALESLGSFTLADGRSNIPLDILGLERSIQLLKVGGRIAIVLPDSVLSNKNTSFVREWLSRNVSVKAVISLPNETFSPFGANIKTSVLILVKEPPSAGNKVFLCELDDVGYDSSGRPSGNTTSIENVALGFDNFISEEGWNNEI